MPNASISDLFLRRLVDGSFGRHDDDWYDDGHDDGHDDGYDDGYDDWYNDGPTSCRDIISEWDYDYYYSD
jgi:hypothetical protein